MKRKKKFSWCVFLEVLIFFIPLLFLLVGKLTMPSNISVYSTQGFCFEMTFEIVRCVCWGGICIYQVLSSFRKLNKRQKILSVILLPILIASAICTVLFTQRYLQIGAEAEKAENFAKEVDTIEAYCTAIDLWQQESKAENIENVFGSLFYVVYFLLSRVARPKKKTESDNDDNKNKKSGDDVTEQ